MSELVALAECQHPVTPEGREFLHHVYWKFVQNINDYGDRYDGMFQIVDASIPKGAAAMWMAFSDLGAWEIDVALVMGNEGDAESRARVALGVIGDRLIGRLDAEDRVCQSCKSDNDVQGGICIDCFREMPVGEWIILPIESDQQS